MRRLLNISTLTSAVEKIFERHERRRNKTQSCVDLRRGSPGALRSAAGRARGDRRCNFRFICNGEMWAAPAPALGACFSRGRLEPASFVTQRK
ncbi:hypothetical protein EVAR_95627_1 [Eumeta japonica]|uniref:Uncharacterized protein n=1 Tax=Eumeta variegata TaxID=151549 RepID=A0A4C2AAU7_EUMVA|nr:hypothetical protein EVAR_95627_1 [Eumeta japonica]